MREGRADFACVPFENSVDGIVSPTSDALATGPRLQILAETELGVAFSILVRPGTRLNQLRLKAGEPPKLETRSVGVDLSGSDGGIVGFRGRRHAGVVDLDNIDGHDPRDFWEPLSLRRGELLLDPGEFYILASSDDVEIPVDQAAEMTPIDPSVGEFRVHYAGFFDPGFGHAAAGGRGARARAGRGCSSTQERWPCPSTRPRTHCGPGCTGWSPRNAA